MSPRLELKLELRDSYGRTHGVIVREVPGHVAYQGEHAADDFKMGAIVAERGASAFEGAMSVLRVRELRRKDLQEFAAQLGAALADFLQDREGWHGIDRQEATERIANERK